MHTQKSIKMKIVNVTVHKEKKSPFCWINVFMYVFMYCFKHQGNQNCPLLDLYLSSEPRQAQCLVAVMLWISFM